MSLDAGTPLGPYQIAGQVGAGGMGEVYRARDTRLGRDVAIKILPASVAADADRRARFEREAQVVAALSHPNIVAVFDTGTHEGRLFVVMELLAGETLRARLAKGALSVRKAVDMAVQIARGLGAAHGKGLIHRDLKPENIFLLDDGQVKILDFGLARQVAAADAAPGATETMAATDPGTVLGTVGYMAPEQVRGQAVDTRADVFAFGAVLYEMISGQRAFARDTAADTMTAILTQDPPELAGSRPELSPGLDRIIRHCLEKNTNERFQSARDIAFALEALSGTAAGSVSGASAVATAAPAARPVRGRWRVPALVAGVAIAALAAGVEIERARQPAPGRVTFEARTWEPQRIVNARFGPDGQTLFYSAVRGGIPGVYVVAPGAVVPQSIGDAGTHLLAVSTTGELAVLTGASFVHHRIFRGTLSRMTRDGASRPWLADVSELDYAPDGTNAAVARFANGHWQLEYPIGKVLYVAQTGYISDPKVSPDGTRVAFMDHPLAGDNRGPVKVIDAAGHAVTLTPEYWGEEGLAWSRDGGTVFFGTADSNAQADIAAVNVRSTPVVRQVAAGPGTFVVGDVAPDGRILVVRSEERFAIRALEPGSTAERDVSWLDFPLAPSLSRDGKRMVFTDLSQSAGLDYAVAVRDMATDKVVRLGPGASLGVSPDGKWAAAQVPSTLKLVVYPTGAGDPVTLEPRFDTTDDVEWFSDSRRVLYCGGLDAKSRRCYTKGLAGDGAAVPVTPEGVTGAVLAGDDRTLLIRLASGAAQLMTIGGGAAADAKGFDADDRLLTWTADLGGVVVSTAGHVPAVIERVDVPSGRRTRLAELAPSDRTGIARLEFISWLPDGRGHAYSYARSTSQLFVVRITP